MLICTKNNYTFYKLFLSENLLKAFETYLLGLALQTVVRFLVSVVLCVIFANFVRPMLVKNMK